MKIPFPMTMAMTESEREAQMAKCPDLPKLYAQKIDEDAVLHIACYGPSLEDSWRDIGYPLLTVSGAHDYLIARGLIPDFHAEMDPRPHKVKFLKHPHPGVTYLIASVCHPSIWPALKDQNVRVWHIYSGPHTSDWIAQNAPDSLLVRGGSSIGLSAIHLGGVLGYRHFEIHGMDGCLRDGKRHVSDHYGHDQEKVTWHINGKKFWTTKIMMNSNAELINMLWNFPIFCVFHGEGLMQEMIRNFDMANTALAETEKADKVRKACYVELKAA